MTKYWLLIDKELLEEGDFSQVTDIRFLGDTRPWDDNWVITQVEDKNAPEEFENTVSEFAVDSNFNIFGRRIIYNGSTK